MAIADDVTSLEAALTAVRSTSYAPADIVKLLDTAILNPVVRAGKFVASYTIGGKTLTMALGEARQLRQYYHELERDDGKGGLVPQFSEFTP